MPGAARFGREGAVLAPERDQTVLPLSLDRMRPFAPSAPAPAWEVHGRAPVSSWRNPPMHLSIRLRTILALDHALAVAPTRSIRPVHLPDSVRTDQSRSFDAGYLRNSAVQYANDLPEDNGGRYRETIEQVERGLIRHALSRYAGNQTDAADFWASVETQFETNCAISGSASRQP